MSYPPPFFTLLTIPLLLLCDIFLPGIEPGRSCIISWSVGWMLRPGGSVVGSVLSAEVPPEGVTVSS